MNGFYKKRPKRFCVAHASAFAPRIGVAEPQPQAAFWAKIVKSRNRRQRLRRSQNQNFKQPLNFRKGTLGNPDLPGSA
ncbi:MAG: hypothetical protein MUD08_04435 [Cytophagales bacterium]|jgi:hypothetical protein|nr:hypothetical protein [Cytophagales bacterium]